jgi:hypothetical protein
VSQEGANRVAGFIMQMIQFRNAQSFDSGQRGFARVLKHAHEPSYGGRVTGQGLDTE